MHILRLILKNTLRHKLRSLLTILGMGVAVMAFGFMRTVVTAWYAGVEASSANRLITSHAVSFIFPLPYSYRDQIARIPDVTGVSYANWFGGVYKNNTDYENFFPRIAIDPETYFTLYPEFIVPPEDLAAFKADRRGCLVGAKIAGTHGFKRGDIIPIEGDIFPGHWEFVVRGIYKGRDPSTDETQMFFQWNYLNEQVKINEPGREGTVGWYVVDVKGGPDVPVVSKAVDDLFANSRAQTKTQTERQFQQGFISMSSAIITSVKVISLVVIGIILLVLANTIVMSVRERTREYAVLKTLGFTAGHIAGLIAGESLALAAVGGLLGLALTFPVARGFAAVFPTWFPVFNVETSTIVMAIGSAIFAGVVAAVIPSARMLRLRIVDGLRQAD